MPAARHAEEVNAAALQYVGKLSGTARPPGVNAEAFDRAVAAASRELLEGLVVTGEPKDREVEAAKARERSRRRYAEVGLSLCVAPGAQI